MTTPLTPPTFGDKYSVAPTDIGGGYAAGITSAGKSIAGAIGSVMGSFNQETGQMQPGIMDQKQSSQDMLDALHVHGVIKDDEYQKLSTSGLTAQQKMIGFYTSEFNTRLAAQLDKEKALAVQQAESASAITRQGMAGSSAEKVARIGQEYRNREDVTPVVRQPTTNQVALPNTYGGNPALNNPIPQTKLF